MIKLKSILYEIKKESSLKEFDLLMEKVRKQVEKDFGPQNESESEKEIYKQKLLEEIKEKTKNSPPIDPKKLLKEIKEFSNHLLD
jgi:hypothetical protein